MAEIVGRHRPSRREGQGAGKPRTTDLLMDFDTAPAKILNLTVVYDSVNPLMPLEKQFTVNQMWVCSMF